MRTLLQINSGIHGNQSQSSQLANFLTENLLAGEVGTRHIKRDLSTAPPPHLDAGTFEVFSDPDAASTPAQKAGLALSDTLIGELKSADILVIGTPMYNLGISSMLKCWIDHVIRAGETFQYTDQGPEGLLSDKQTYIVAAQGGNFLGTEADLLSKYMSMALGFIGLSTIEFIYAKGLALGPQAAAAGLKSARDQIGSLTQMPI